MADPVTIGIGLAVAGTATKVVSSIQQGKAQSKQLDEQAGANDLNRTVALQDAEISEQQAAQEAGRIDRENRLRKAGVVASAAGSGVGIDGSVLDVLTDLVAQGELDKQDAIYEGQLQSRGYRLTAVEQARQAAGARSGAKDAKRAGYFAAGADLLQGASNVYTMGGEAGYFGGGSKAGSPVSLAPAAKLRRT